MLEVRQELFAGLVKQHCWIPLEGGHNEAEAQLHSRHYDLAH